MEFILEIINTYGVKIIGTILTALAGVLALAAKNLATKCINTKVKQEIARIVVRGVEQCFSYLSGPEKMERAMEAAADMLNAQGINVTELELHMLLEAAVGEFNDVFAKNASSIVLDGIDVEELDDDQLRSLLQQCGFVYTENMSREAMLAALDEA